MEITENDRKRLRKVKELALGRLCAWMPPIDRAHLLAMVGRCLTTALTCFALSACGAAPEGEARATVLRESDLHVMGTSDSIALVEDLAVLPDGSVWVQNSVEPFFIGFGPKGDLLAAHGRRGGGPNESGSPVGFVVGGVDGEAWIFDRRRHVLTRISTPDVRAEIPLPHDAIPPGSVMTGMSLLGSTIRLATLNDDIVLPRRSGTGEISATAFWTTIWNADLVALDPETGSVRTVLSLREAMGDLTSYFQTLNGGFPPFPLWYRLWAVCDDEIRLYDFVRDELRGFTAAGVELQPIPVPPPFTEATPRQFARAVFDLAVVERAGAVTPGMAEMSAADSAEIVNGFVERLEGTPEQLGGLLPKFVDFRCADDGTMWLRPLDLERGGLQGGQGWLRISEGKIREIRFPARFDPYRFTSGRAWGVLRDELDIAAVAWIPVPGGD